MSSADIPAPQPWNRYKPNEIVLYGIKLNEHRDSGVIPFGDAYISIEVHEKNGDVTKNDRLAIAVIYSYSFEGGCYRFDRPKVMIFRAKDTSAKGCGYDDTEFRSWRIDSKTFIMEMDTEFDIAEKLVLEANLPGKRSPSTYSVDMQLAHRGKSLTRNGGMS